MQGNNKGKGVRVKDLNSKEIALGKNKPTITWIYGPQIFLLCRYMPHLGSIHSTCKYCIL